MKKISELQCLLSVVYVAALMIANVVEAKQSAFFGGAMTCGNLVFPITYILSDVFQQKNLHLGVCNEYLDGLRIPNCNCDTCAGLLGESASIRNRSWKYAANCCCINACISVRRLCK